MSNTLQLEGVSLQITMKRQFAENEPMPSSHCRLPPPREPWDPPTRQAREPSVRHPNVRESSFFATALRLSTPPPSPRTLGHVASTDLTNRNVASDNLLFGMRQSHRFSPDARSDSDTMSSHPAASRRQSISDFRTSVSRGKELRGKKQDYWKAIEDFLLQHGGLDGAKQLHSGNKKSSYRDYQERDILKDVEFLLRHLSQDPRTLEMMRQILQYHATLRNAS